MQSDEHLCDISYGFNLHIASHGPSKIAELLVKPVETAMALQICLFIENCLKLLNLLRFHIFLLTFILFGTNVDDVFMGHLIRFVKTERRYKNVFISVDD